MKSVFLDANVWLDSLLQRPGHESADLLIRLIDTGAIKCYYTAVILHIIAYHAGKRLSPSDVSAGLSELVKRCHLLQVVEDDIVAAIAHPVPDIEDAMMLFACERMGIEVLATGDKKLISESVSRKIKVITATDALIAVI